MCARSSHSLAIAYFEPDHARSLQLIPDFLPTLAPAKPPCRRIAPRSRDHTLSLRLLRLGIGLTGSLVEISRIGSLANYAFELLPDVANSGRDVGVRESVIDTGSEVNDGALHEAAL